jgi:hypothetical protein
MTALQNTIAETFGAMPLCLTVNGISKNYVLTLFAAEPFKNARAAATDADRYTCLQRLS